MPCQHGRREHPIAACTQFIAATHEIDGALHAAAEHDDAIDLFRQRRARKPLFERVEHQRAKRGPGREGEDEKGQPAAGGKQLFTPDQGSKQRNQQQDDRQIQRLDEEPKYLGKIVEHPSPFRWETTLPPLFWLERTRRLFDDMGGLEQSFLVEGPADELQAERQALGV